MNPSCPVIPVISTASNFANANVLYLLSIIAFLCYGFYSIATDIFQAAATSAAATTTTAAASEQQVKESSFGEFNDFSLSDLIESEDQMEEIELELLPPVKRSLNPGDDDHDYYETQSPKLMVIEPLVFEEPKSNDQDDLVEEVHELHKRQQEEQEIQQEEQEIQQDAQEIQQEEQEIQQEEQNQLDLIEQVPIKKPLEYYLKWNIPIEELSYSEKARRFYHLTTYGEVQIIKKEPPEEHQQKVEPDDKDFNTKNIENFSYQHFELNFVDNERFINQQECSVVQLYQEPLQPRWVPVNLLSDLVNKADRIDIPQFQMDLLKMNCIFNCEFLKDLSCQFIRNQMKMKIMDPLPMVTLLKNPIMINYNYNYKHPKPNKIYHSKHEKDIVWNSFNNMSVAFVAMKNLINHPKAFQIYSLKPKNQQKILEIITNNH